MQTQSLPRFVNGNQPHNCANERCREPLIPHTIWRGSNGRYYCSEWCEEEDFNDPVPSRQ